MPVTAQRWTWPGLALPAFGMLVLACAASIFLSDPAGLTAAATGTRLQDFLASVQTLQRDLHRDLATALRDVSRAGPTAAWPLVVLSALYGVFHAAGPGHGKAVMATYLTTQDAHLGQPLSLRHLTGVVLAIGLRPCSGAILVLLVAHALHLRWAGIAAVAAMSLGTAATVSALAVVSVFARRITLRRVGGNARAAWANMALSGVGILGGAAICMMGLALLGASLSTPAHPLF